MVTTSDAILYNREIVLGYELKDIDDIINDLLQKKVTLLQ